MLPVSPLHSGSTFILRRSQSGSGCQPLAEGDRQAQNEIKVEDGWAGVTDSPARVVLGSRYLKMFSARGYLATEENTVASTTVQGVTARGSVPTVPALEAFVRSAIDADPAYVHLLKDGAFRIKLHAPSDADLLLQSDKLFRDGFPLILERWSADRVMDNDELRKRFLWVAMPGLPLHLVNMADDMIAQIGRLVVVPGPRPFLESGSNPRWGVKVAPGTQLPKGICVEDPDDPGKVIWQKFYYPELQGRCTSCGDENHRHNNGCPKATPWNGLSRFPDPKP